VNARWSSQVALVLLELLKARGLLPRLTRKLTLCLIEEESLRDASLEWAVGCAKRDSRGTFTHTGQSESNQDGHGLKGVFTAN